MIRMRLCAARFIASVFAAAALAIPVGLAASSTGCSQDKVQFRQLDAVNGEIGARQETIKYAEAYNKANPTAAPLTTAFYRNWGDRLNKELTAAGGTAQTFPMPADVTSSTPSTPALNATPPPNAPNQPASLVTVDQR